jgi:hypothetical protein
VVSHTERIKYELSLELVLHTSTLVGEVHKRPRDY